MADVETTLMVEGETGMKKQQRKAEKKAGEGGNVGKKAMVPFRVDAGVKSFLQRFADGERRSLNNFLVNAVLTYVKDHHGVDWSLEGRDGEKTG